MKLKDRDLSHGCDNNFCDFATTVTECLLSLQRPTAAHKINDQHDHSNNEEQMDERATKMTDEAK